MSNEEKPESEDLTPEEIEELKMYMASLGSSVPRPEEKVGIFQFFNQVLKTKDTSKVSNLDKTELYPVRKLQNAALYIKERKMNLISNYLNQRAEIILATADSKEGFLIKQIITQKKELSTKVPKEGKKKWLKERKEET